MISSVSKSCNDIYSYRPSSSTSKFETISLGTDISDNYISDPVSRKFTETSVSSLRDFKMMYSFITENAPKGQYVDLDAEFSKFLENRGCKDEDELKIIAQANCYTMDEFKQQISRSLLFDSIGLTDGSGHFATINTKYIIENSSIEDLSEYNKNRGTTSLAQKLDSFKNLISKLPANESIGFDPSVLTEMVDIILESLKKDNYSVKTSDAQQKFNASQIAKYQR